VDPIPAGPGHRLENTVGWTPPPTAGRAGTHRAAGRRAVGAPPVALRHRIEARGKGHGLRPTGARPATAAREGWLARAHMAGGGVPHAPLGPFPNSDGRGDTISTRARASVWPLAPHPTPPPRLT